MGVHSLWEIVGPTARPVRLEALSRKKLAVDASIWIYQFLKAVRDQEGNALKSSHIVGFFRRICKLLYFGILPVFVFDGGAPTLKRRTIIQRKERRQGRREDAKATAQKLLAIQLQRQAEKSYNERHDISPQKRTSKKIDKDDKMVYLEDLTNLHPGHGNTISESEQQRPIKSPEKRVFKRLDEYHLPEIEAFEAFKSDKRMMHTDEFDQLTEDLDDEVDGVNLNTVDPSSKEFSELAMSTQYMILSNLRLRSRLRMGYSKEQLETLFPNSMEFSKFQIQMVQKRNFLTQSLMNVSGMNESGNVTRRIAGDKDREYSLRKNDDGWTLSLPGKGVSRDNAIDLDEDAKTTRKLANDDEEDDGVEWEDIPIHISKTHNEQIEDTQAKLTELIGDVNSQIKRQQLYMHRDTGNEEGEDQLQAALLESSRNPNDGSKELEEYQMRQAIEASKQDLMELRIKEKAIIDKDVFDFGSAFTGGSVIATSMSERLATVKVPKFSLGSSSLFGTTKTKKDKSNGGIPKMTPFIPVIPESIEISEKLENASEEPKKKPISMPSWFNNSNQNTSVGFNTIGVNNEIRGNQTEDEAAGLVSWNMANEYIQDDISEHEEERDSDIELIENPRLVDNVEIIGPVPEWEPEIPESPTSLQQKSIDNHQEDIIGIEEPVAKERETTNKPEVLDYDFSESEEEQLIEQLQNEEIEHERFKTTINPSFTSQITNEQLLREQQKKDKRDSDEVTTVMIQDVQELLKRFGIPFITAPMEAEAQCAELLNLKLVDGIITDDSDCFLFGGDKIYKNMFNQKNYVECYFMNDLERDLGLSQTKLIDLAMLLGSDYTEGIKGVGPVLAMEILAEFSTIDDSRILETFRDWWINIQNGGEIPDDETSIQRKLRKKFKGKLFLDKSFPEKLVYEAYYRPEVDKDKTEFKWGTPDLDQIRTFLMYNVGWSQQRVDEVLVPVIKDMNKKKSEGTQSTLGEFFPRELMQKRRDLMTGKRLKTATSKLSKKRKSDQDS